MTNHWVDIKNANVVMVMGGNAAEAHPVGFRWAMEAKNNNDATLIVVDPRFTRTASVADIYAPIRSGTDITFLSGVLRYLIGTISSMKTAMPNAMTLCRIRAVYGIC